VEYFAEFGYVGLFIASFLAATILPFSSEVVFTAVVWKMGSDPWICVAAATVGNTLGGMTCYWLGMLGKMEWIEKYLGIKQAKVDKWVDKLHKQGDWIAFFSFMPAIGDLIAVACGFLRCNGWIVLAAMFAGKLIRYIVWMYVQGIFI
jgi:membrane protein YqaA with SNARE-associated domain